MSVLHDFGMQSDWISPPPLPAPGDAAPPRGRPGPPALLPSEGAPGEGGGDLDLLSEQPAHRPRGGGAQRGAQDQMLRYS